MIFVLFGTMLVLFAIGVPIAFGMGIAAITSLSLMPRSGFEIVVQRMFFGLDSFVILSVPLFLLLGELMEQAKITDRLVQFSHAFVGRLRGGLAHVSIVTEMIMSGISGSGTADAAATASVLLPAMRQDGYPLPFSAAVLGAAAVLGPIIPPSIVMLIYASVANVSIGRMFLGGIIPGLIMGVCLMIVTAVLARKYNFPRGEKPTIRSVAVATKRASLVLVAPLIVILGIVGGVFTATESAAVASVYALILGVCIYRTIPINALPDIVLRTAWTSGKVMFVFAAASIFSWILARSGVTEQFASIPLLTDTSRPWVMLVMLNFLLLMLGCLMDSIAIVVIITPMFLPFALQAGIDPIHLGVVMAVNISIGLVTPPVGGILFVLCALTRLSMVTLSKALLPFFIALILPLILITYVPQVVTFLPDLLMGPR